ncbi:hypothetical protein Pyn_25858 [Prunus yedoensis var. nudiflora]|uniref:Uncharacterized protein n=1 Tax=Prunus yedoensis var. nudiflora TaxID=2094558 RepID=A0A314UYB9_PRUYE|nr:hypothetical protein Pyn_25858 [Prunus yedoensis var. nudiflora]
MCVKSIKLFEYSEGRLRLSSTILPVLTSSKVYCVRELNPPGFASGVEIAFSEPNQVLAHVSSLNKFLYKASV